MKLLTFIAFAIHFIAIKAIPINVALVKDYLKFNNIQIGLFLSCDNLTERVQRTIELQSDDVWISDWDISNENELQNFNYKKKFRRLASPLIVVLNLECDLSFTVMKEISARKMFHYERYWLMFCRNWEPAYEVLRHQFINMDAEIYLAIQQNEKDYQIYEVFNLSYLRGGQLNISKIAYWNSDDGFKIVSEQTKIERRHDLKGLTFHTAIAIPAVPKNMSFVEHIESNEYPFMDSGDKNNHRLFQLIKDMFNFNLIVHRVSVWGVLSPNGTWKGVIGMLSRGEVDLAVPAFRWANERYGVFEQTTHSYHIQYVFLFLHPRSIDATRIYTSPFDSIVWSLILLVSLVIACAIRQTLVIENRKYVKNALEKTGNEYTYSNSILMVLVVLGFFFQQGYFGNPLLNSSRILITTILIFSAVTFQFYSSFIVGSLLTEAPKTIKTVQQLLNSELDCFIDEIAYIRDHIEHYKEESVVRLYNKITEHPSPFLPLQEGVDLIKMGGHAFYTDGNHGYQLLEKLLTDQEACDLQEVKYIPKVPGGPGVPNKSPFRELIKISLRKISETGIMPYYWKVWIGHRPKCSKNSVDVVPVDLLHFSSALYVQIVGMQISLGVLLGEIIMNRCRKRKPV